VGQRFTSTTTGNTSTHRHLELIGQDNETAAKRWRVQFAGQGGEFALICSYGRVDRSTIRDDAPLRLQRITYDITYLWAEAQAAQQRKDRDVVLLPSLMSSSICFR
jgi:hypothetical protein